MAHSKVGAKAISSPVDSSASRDENGCLFPSTPQPQESLSAVVGLSELEGRQPRHFSSLWESQQEDEAALSPLQQDIPMETGAAHTHGITRTSWLNSTTAATKPVIVLVFLIRNMIHAEVERGDKTTRGPIVSICFLESKGRICHHCCG